MRKRVVRKAPLRKKAPSRRKSSFWRSQTRSLFVGIISLLLLGLIAYHYRNGLAYYLGFKSDKILLQKEAKRISDVRNYQVLSKYEDKVVGFDVSQYQGAIRWDAIHVVENTYPLQFVFIRATAGKDKEDTQFATNWQQAKKYHFIRGAYHYYRPNENSLEQANNFIKTVQLAKGDLPPVLDIESLPKNQSVDSLKVGLKRWLEKVTAHYKIRPILYTNEKYYEDFLKDSFSEYPFWIANYNFFVEDIQDDWLFWQFTEKATIEGINGNVDVTIYNGTPKMLRYFTLN